MNCDHGIAAIFKEVRALESMKFEVPVAVKMSAQSVQLNYNFARALAEGVRRI